MLSYIIRRLLLIIPTLLGIMVINFVIVQSAPGGPIETILARLEGTAIGATERFTGGGGETAGSQSSQQAGAASETSSYRGRRGLDPAFIAQLEKQFGFDRPLPERFLKMLVDYATFDFGTSYFKGRPVVELIVERLPVSISLGLWTTLITYLISIPLGIMKAVRDGSKFDVWTSTLILAGNAVPSFLFAILLIVLFAGGAYLDWFPLRGLVSDNWDSLSWPAKILDYFWHLTLPLAALLIGAFAGLTMLTKNSFLDQIRHQYVVTARAKGLTERRVLYGHVFRNAMIIVIAGFPGLFFRILFTGALLIETIFSLDGLGRLGFEAVVNRDYGIMFPTLYFFTLIGMIFKLIADFTYTIVDPRIDFEGRAI
jgi:microcin C transport system permease protein